MFKRIGKTTLAIALALPSISTGVTVFANDENAGSQTDTDTETSTSYPAAQDGYTYVSSVTSASKDANSVTLTLEAGERIRFTFLEGNVFRMYMAAPGEEFQEYPTPNSSDHLATITEKSDAEYYTDYKVDPQLIEDDATVTMMVEGGITITVDKASAMMTVTNAQGETVVKEPLRSSIARAAPFRRWPPARMNISMAAVRRTDVSLTKVRSSAFPTPTTGSMAA